MTLSASVRRAGRLLLVVCGYFVLAFGAHVLGGLIDQPHPDYGDGRTWFQHRLPSSLRLAEVVCFVVAVGVLLDLVSQGIGRRPLRDCDLAYYPRLLRLRGLLSHTPSRLFVIVGFLGLGGYVASAVNEVWVARILRANLVWPPERVCASIMLAWGILWVADCLRRPRAATIVAALAFLLFAVWYTTVAGVGVLRE
jgi:hypothetical protein